MPKKKVLFITQEITPYVPKSEISGISRQLPQIIQEKGHDIRTFMPRYGNVNERRNQLHEVIRLSGMNLIIDDTDHPLIIKVASIQSARMQVYFIDNDDFFGRKAMFKDKDGAEFEDNDERSIFFVRGALETVRKLRWIPDVIHCHGWMTALAPLYIKTMYKDDPCFCGTKIIYSIYREGFSNPLNSGIIDKLKFDGIEESNLDPIRETPNFVSLNKLAILHSDGVIYGSDSIDPQIDKYIAETKEPANILSFQGENDYADAYEKFYEMI